MCNHKCSICPADKKECDLLESVFEEFQKKPIPTLLSPCYLTYSPDHGGYWSIEEGDWHTEKRKLAGDGFYFLAIDLTYHAYKNDAPEWVAEAGAETDEEIDTALREMCKEHFHSKMEEVRDNHIIPF